MKNTLAYRLKSLLLLSIVVLSSYLVSAQDAPLLNPGQYLFNEFSRGRVAMKAGRDLNMVLNYNIVTELIVFQQKGQIYDLSNPETVDTIYISGHKFIPVGKVYYEVAIEEGLPLFIQHRGKIQDPPRPAAYGGSSEVSSSTYINNATFHGQVYRLQNDPTIIIKPEYIYWTMINGDWRSFISSRQLNEILSDKKISVSKYVKQNKLKFENPEDVTKLIVWCNTQLK